MNTKPASKTKGPRVKPASKQGQGGGRPKKTVFEATGFGGPDSDEKLEDDDDEKENKEPLDISELSCISRLSFNANGLIEFTCLIPSSNPNVQGRAILKATSTLAELQELVYESIGCTEIKIKPALGWKYSTAAQKAPVSLLKTDEDWEAAVEDLCDKEHRRKSGRPAQLAISLLDNTVCLILYLFCMRC